LRRHTHFGLDDLQSQRPIINLENITHAGHAEFWPTKLFGQLFGNVDIQQAHLGREGKAISCNRQQQHRHIDVHIPRGRRETELDDGLPGAFGRGNLIIAQDLAHQAVTHLVCQLLDLHPTRSGTFRCQSLDLAQVVDKILVLDDVFDIVGADDIVVGRNHTLPHKVEHMWVV
jgi:hypothetical protein